MKSVVDVEIKLDPPMRWYVALGARKFGPMRTELVHEFLATGTLGDGVFVREESTDSWQPIELSQFREMVRKPKRTRADLGWRLLLVLALTFGAVTLLWLGWISILS